MWVLFNNTVQKVQSSVRKVSFSRDLMYLPDMVWSVVKLYNTFMAHCLRLIFRLYVSIKKL